GGIDPDVVVTGVEAHPLTQVLFEKGFILDFVTEYVQKNPKPVHPRDFTLTEEEYHDFVSWMKGKDYAYKSYVEYGILQLVEEAKKEKYYEGLRAHLDQISNKLVEGKKTELMLNKDQIKRLLEEEIVARHHLDKGKIEAAFKYDLDVKKAVEMLHDGTQYRKVLHVQ
ncbi:MAG: peptidase S41, partial [Cyclobacteriaceae bacterium]